MQADFKGSGILPNLRQSFSPNQFLSEKIREYVSGKLQIGFCFNPFMHNVVKWPDIL